MTLEIRLEKPQDRAAVFEVVRRAFGRSDEAVLVDRLRDGGWVRLSLVAEDPVGQLVGHLLFSELKIVGPAGTTTALALAPMAVVPERQSQGIGGRLVRHGLDLCRQAGHSIVLVVGHPHYYPRFGFSAELARGLDSPYAGEAFMALELVAESLQHVRGRVCYPPPFSQV